MINSFQKIAEISSVCSNTDVRNLFVLSLLYIYAVTGCVTSAPKDEYRASLYLEAGEEQLAKGDYPNALSSLLQAEKLAPKQPRVLNALGMAYLAQSQFDYAIQYLEQALEESPQFTDAHNNLGRVYLSVRKFDQAEKHLDIALRDLTYPTPEKPLTNMGLLYFQKKDYRKAKDYYLKAIKANREFCSAHNQYGQTLMQMKDFEAAGQVLDRAIRVCVENPEEVHYLSALSYYQMGKKDIAMARLQEVMKLYPASEYGEKARSLLSLINQTSDQQGKQQDKK